MGHYTKYAQKHTSIAANTYYLKQCQICIEDIVKVDLGVFPGVVMSLVQLVTYGYVPHDGEVNRLSLNIHTLPVASSEQVHPHDAEDEPEN